MEAVSRNPEAQPHLISPQRSGSISGSADWNSLNDFNDGGDQSSPVIKRRAGKACRSCRQTHTKCVHDGVPPCQQCVLGGTANDCEFVRRGAPNQDRYVRRPRKKAEKRPRNKSEDPYTQRGTTPISTSHQGLELTTIPAGIPQPENDWSLLPDVPTIQEGIEALTIHFFQLGFIPKEQFPKQLEQKRESMSVFLLLSILSLSARFNDNLKLEVDNFTRKCEWVAQREFWQPPTLERCQAFFLLSIAQHGSERGTTSYMNMGIATRMATAMRLHREETFDRVTSNSRPEEIIRAESARRTLWMLHSQDNLHSGPYKPESLGNKDITLLLPSNEEDFSTGRYPQRRAALEGTPPAHRTPALSSLGDRSMFATLIQTHFLWGIIARRALTSESKCPDPSDSRCEYRMTARKLEEFEAGLPEEHRFNSEWFTYYRDRKEDLAYITCTATLRLCNIVLRKAYMEEMIQATRGALSKQESRTYKLMSDELSDNVTQLFEQIEAQLNLTDSASGFKIGAPMASFTVYTCGLLASYFIKVPKLRSANVSGRSQTNAQNMYDVCMKILEMAEPAWPLAGTWVTGLKSWCEDKTSREVSFKAGTMADGKESQPAYAVLPPPTRSSPWPSNTGSFFTMQTPTTVAEHRRFSYPTVGYETPMSLAPLQQSSCNQAPLTALPSLQSIPPFPPDSEVYSVPWTASMAQQPMVHTAALMETDMNFTLKDGFHQHLNELMDPNYNYPMAMYDAPIGYNIQANVGNILS